MLISDLVYCSMIKHIEMETPLLSKWWKSKSAKAAMRRAIVNKKKKHAEWIAKVKAYRAAQQKEVNNWGVIA